MKLSELKENQNAVVAKLDGDNRFISRITSRDTMIALNRKECGGIEVTEV